MHSVAHFILKNNPSAKILYVTSEKFTNELIDAIRNKNNVSTTEFREKYRNIDVLLIDDVQFKSSGMMGEFLKIEWMGQVTSLENFDGDGIGTFNPSDDDKVEIGAATHKIGDKSYTLILLTYTPTTTPANPL